MDLVVILLIVLLVLALVGLFRRPAHTGEQAMEVRHLREALDRNEKLLREELARNREELANALAKTSDTGMSAQKMQLDSFAQEVGRLKEATDRSLETLRTVVENRLRTIQEENSRQLEQMRSTVDEKLHATLEHRLGESFRQVSERLEQVHRGLGDMQHLAAGVGDLKRVLTNVKARGTWGEFQLGAILEQILHPDQYARNVATKQGSSERVEYAIKLPGQSGAPDGLIWLPIDAKFPHEDYQRLVDAQNQANPPLVETTARALEASIKNAARDIRMKYVNPPMTTDFAIMFLPVESLYAEVLRRPGLVEFIQREHRVTIAGPTTMAALLNSLQMGFRTLAIEKRSSEVWTLLGTVKTEFGKFGEILVRTKRKLDEASSAIDDAETRTRSIERKLRDVQELPSGDGQIILGFQKEQQRDDTS